MDIHLDSLETRVLGALIEKAITTPDQYPLSLNALVNACNQKSNREPVMELEERTVQDTVDRLAKKHLVVERATYGSRVTKYQHRLCNTGFGSLELSPQELAVMCELLLRGAQTPGELRSRAARMATFSDISGVEGALKHLMERPEGPFVTLLEREPGRREARYMHLLGSEPLATGTEVERGSAEPPMRDMTRNAGNDALEERVAQLERLVDDLQRQIARLREED